VVRVAVAATTATIPLLYYYVRLCCCYCFAQLLQPPPYYYYYYCYILLLLLLLLSTNTTNHSPRPSSLRYAVLFCTFPLYSCTAVAAASVNSHTSPDAHRLHAHGGPGVAFGCIWTMFTFLVIAGYGTTVLRRYHQPFAVGSLLGMTFIASQLAFVMFGVFAGLSGVVNEDDVSVSSADKAMATFSFFLFVAYSVFTVLLLRFRTDLVEGAEAAPYIPSSRKQRTDYDDVGEDFDDLEPGGAPPDRDGFRGDAYDPHGGLPSGASSGEEEVY